MAESAQASMIKGTLNLMIMECENLKKKDLLNKMDPYVIVEFNKQTWKTECCKKGHQNPTWNETLEIPIEGVSLNDKICFKVYDKELIKDNAIGKAELTFQQLANCCKDEKDCTIQLETFGFLDKDKPAGTLKIKPCFSGSGWPGCQKSGGVDQKLGAGSKSHESLGPQGRSVPQGGVNPTEGTPSYEGQPLRHYEKNDIGSFPGPSGHKADSGVSDYGSKGIGQKEDMGVSDYGSKGIGQKEDTGVSDYGSKGIGQKDVGVSDYGSKGIGQKEDVGVSDCGRKGDVGVSDCGSKGIGQKADVGVSDYGSTGIGQKDNGGVNVPKHPGQENVGSYKTTEL